MTTCCPMLGMMCPQDIVLEPGSARGKNVCIIGGTGGVGQALALKMAADGANVTVVGRTFRDAGTKNLTFMKADFTLVSEQRRVGAELPAEDLDVLIFTTGILAPFFRTETADGIEVDTSVSYLSRYVILRAVADRLGKNRPGQPVVFVMGFPGLPMGCCACENNLNGDKCYNQFTIHMSTVVLNEALVLGMAEEAPQLHIYGLNPGLIASGELRTAVLGTGCCFQLTEGCIKKCTPSSTEYAATIVPKLLSPTLQGTTGFHLAQNGAPTKPAFHFTDSSVKMLMRKTEDLLSAKGGPKNEQMTRLL